MVAIYKGDDTNAFGENFLKISLKNDANLNISKVIFQCGPVQKVFVRPTFPIYVNFSHAESNRLPHDGECYLQIFDEKGLRKTVEGSISITAKAKVVSDEQKRGY